MTPVRAEDQEVGRRRSSPDTGGAEGVASDSSKKRAAGRQLVPKRLGRQGKTEALGWNRRSSAVIEVIRKRQSSRHAGVGCQERVAFDDADRAFEHQGLAHPALLDDSGSIERLDKGPAGTVAAGAFAGIDLDDAIIDPQAGQGGHHVFDHLDGRRALPDGGAALGRDDLVDPGGHRRSIRQVGSHEDDARARRRPG